MDTAMIKNVGQIGIPVKDIKRALNFYKDKLGLSLLFNTDSMAFFECDGLRLMLTLPEKEEFAHSSSVIYFQVNNIKDTYERLVGKEVTFIDEPHVVTKMGQTEMWMVFFKDTEDNTHALMSEVQV
ncbi:VOC family protein [Rossellomorea aquimaris]|jgi:methylmalonyl-CoA/ethylmalonyl-CoA epimerase|uniref:VOC family protein n=1 Tax=Rossellomorea aquimaris TaxID=189382 RepID=A0A5D4UJ77_9BACI|nr:VOC family protein [Rossellomorea aquimaris]TYS77980.1 VOC family protein [Rossellomorea aquimaris]TYS87161.1 VOC family protein [Rossellomorea aquimaris]